MYRGIVNFQSLVSDSMRVANSAVRFAVRHILTGFQGAIGRVSESFPLIQQSNRGRYCGLGLGFVLYLTDYFGASGFSAGDPGFAGTTVGCSEALGMFGTVGEAGTSGTLGLSPGLPGLAGSWDDGVPGALGTGLRIRTGCCEHGCNCYGEAAGFNICFHIILFSPAPLSARASRFDFMGH